MLGMSLVSFLVLLAIGTIVAVVVHFVFRYRFMEGLDSLLGKIALGWVGGWLASPVLGHWLYRIENVYVVPAVLGAAAAIFLNVLFWRALAKACGSRSGA